jgi:hypothetical protein
VFHADQLFNMDQSIIQESFLAASCGRQGKNLDILLAHSFGCDFNTLPDQVWQSMVAFAGSAPAEQAMYFLQDCHFVVRLTGDFQGFESFLDAFVV